jgi:hypothetical protein
MTSANDPTVPPTSITGEAPAPPGTGVISAENQQRIPLPPPPEPQRAVVAPEVLQNWMSWLDAALVLVVLVLGFLLGSFLARNADVWQHLATGRLVAHGEYPFGKDPFTYTAPDSPWINTSWLSDLGGYLLFTAGGGETGAGGRVLVIVKALLIALLGAILLAIRRPGQSLWAPALGTALALVTLSPRAALHPISLSLLFLGLTLYLLQRPPAEPDSTAGRWFRWTGGRAWVLLPVVFALWVNLDAWFLLGPATVLLYFLGGLVQHVLGLGTTSADEPRREELPRLAAVLVIGLAACLLNPYLTQVFTTLPPDLAGLRLGDDLRQDPMYRRLFLSPFVEGRSLIELQSGAYANPQDSQNVAGFAYFALLLLGLVSFAVNVDGWSWWRAVVWLGFAALSGWQFRAIPFFAVVGGPISALNLQDYAARRFGSEPRVVGFWPAWSLGGRFLTLVAGLALLFGAWPGWLHAEVGVANSPHRVAWDIEIDPSLRDAAATLRGLRAAGALKDGEHGFNFNPELAYYWAWFAPEEKGFFDYRLNLPPETLKTCSAVRNALPGDLFKAPTTAAEEESYPWQEVFREHNVRYLAFLLRSNRDYARTVVLWAHPYFQRSWTPIYVDGRTAIFGWNDPALNAHPIPDLGRLAFGPTAEKAPEDGPARSPHEGDFWEKYLKAPLPEPLDGYRAELDVGYYENSLGYWSGARQVTELGASAVNRIAICAQLMLPAGTGAGPAGILSMEYTQLRFWFARRAMVAQWLMSPELASGDTGPLPALYLAIRAARRATEANPDSANSYWYLARAYYQLWENHERNWMRNANEQPRRTELRETQLATALQNALLADPRNVDAHELLAKVIFQQLGFLDLELYHLQQALPILEEERPGIPDRQREAIKQRADGMRKRVEELERQVKDRTSSFVVQFKNKPVMAKVNGAINLGLAQKALDLLRDQDPEDLSAKERPAWRESLIRLHLTTGQPHLVLERDLLPSENPWQHVLIFASLGNYAKARSYLTELIHAAKNQGMVSMLLFVRANLMAGAVHPQALRSLISFGSAPRDWADLLLMRGLLALEEGDIAAAEADFQESLRLTDPGRHLTPHLLAPIGVTNPLGAIALTKAGLDNPEQPASYLPQSPVALNYLAHIRRNK